MKLEIADMARNTMKATFAQLSAKPQLGKNDAKKSISASIDSRKNID